jgi:hypothetical protein
MNYRELKQAINESKLSEAPLADYQTIGDFTSPGPFRSQVDKRLVTHPVNIDKTYKFFENTVEDFRIFMCNVPGMGKNSEMGEASPAQIRQLLGDKADPIIDNYQDAITIVYVGNRGTGRVMMTPWIMAHRFGHAIQASARMRDAHGMWSQAEKHFFATVNQYLEEYYSKVSNAKFGLSMRTDLTPEYNALFNAIGTQKSSRTGQINRPYEFLYEIFAQYLQKGQITLNPFPENLSYGRQAWGNPTKYMRAKVASDELADAANMLANDMRYMFDDVLSACIGKIYVM